MSKVMAVVGGQYGSEGKGVIVASMADEYDVHVRTGGPNAGHSFYDIDGTLWKMQSIPCGFINEGARLFIGAGAVINPELTLQEIDKVESVYGSLRGRLFIDEGVTVITEGMRHAEGGVEGVMHRRIGSTGEGVGIARIARIDRDPELYCKVTEMGSLTDKLAPYLCKDTVAELDWLWRHDHNIMLEGTQGAGLSLIHGDWPYVTSHDTTAAQLAADAGIPATRVTDTLLVLRTYPIRVAGNSGPMYQELKWSHISERMGRKTEERTTVTKKIRRIGRWDERLAIKAAQLNGPTALAITFMDYLSPDCEGVTERENLTNEAKSFIQYLEILLEAPVKYIGTGGPTWTVCK